MSNPPMWLIFLIWWPVAVAAGAYIFLMIFDRDRLHSEDFQLRKHGLELIEEKGDLQAVDASTIEAITNPNYLTIEDRSETEE